MAQYHRLALKELEKAAEWYKKRGIGLGNRFLGSVRAGVELIEESPERWPKGPGMTRHYVVRDFPYSIHYQWLNGGVFIMAVAHHKRRANYWKSRRIEK